MDELIKEDISIDFGNTDCGYDHGEYYDYYLECTDGIVKKKISNDVISYIKNNEDCYLYIGYIFYGFGDRKNHGYYYISHCSLTERKISLSRNEQILIEKQIYKHECFENLFSLQYGMEE